MKDKIATKQKHESLRWRKNHSHLKKLITFFIAHQANWLPPMIDCDTLIGSAYKPLFLEHSVLGGATEI